MSATIPPIDSTLAAVLSAVFTVGVESGPTDDVRAVLEFLHHACPDNPLIASALGHQMNVAEEFDKARALLEEADLRAGGHPVLAAMLGATLALLGDRRYKTQIDRVRAMPEDPVALAIIESLEQVLPA